MNILYHGSPLLLTQHPSLLALFSRRLTMISPCQSRKLLSCPGHFVTTTVIGRAIKVSSPVQCAHKLAELAGQMENGGEGIAHEKIAGKSHFIVLQCKYHIHSDSKMRDSQISFNEGQLWCYNLSIGLYMDLLTRPKLRSHTYSSMPPFNNLLTFPES